jgi:hypothetical protein
MSEIRRKLLIQESQETPSNNILYLPLAFEGDTTDYISHHNVIIGSKGPMIWDSNKNMYKFSVSGTGTDLAYSAKWEIDDKYKYLIPTLDGITVAADIQQQSHSGNGYWGWTNLPDVNEVCINGVNSYGPFCPMQPTRYYSNFRGSIPLNRYAATFNYSTKSLKLYKNGNLIKTLNNWWNLPFLDHLTNFTIAQLVGNTRSGVIWAKNVKAYPQLMNDNEILEEYQNNIP